MLRPDFTATVTRGVTRVIGTLLGVGVASLFVLAHPSHAAQTALVGVLAWVAFTVFQANYALFTCALTALVVVLLGFVTTDTIGTAGDRLLDTVIGGAIALAAMAIWPTWSARDATYQLVRLVAAQRAYARAVLGSLAVAGPLDEAALHEVGTRARRERARAEDAVGRALADPAPRRIDPATSSGALAALRRFAFAVHALRADVERGGVERPMPEIAPFARAVSDALRSIGQAIRRGGEEGGPALPPLRSLHSELADALRGRATGLAALAATDEMVDALDTAAVVLGTGAAAPGDARRDDAAVRSSTEPGDDGTDTRARGDRAVTAGEDRSGG